MTRCTIKRSNREHQQTDRDEDDKWASFRRQYELWQHFMRAVFGFTPGHDELLLKMLSRLEVEDAKGYRMPAAQASHAALTPNRVIAGFGHIDTFYTNTEGDDERLNAVNFQLDYREKDEEQQFDALKERAVAALALTRQARMLGWDSVAIGETQDNLDRYMLKKACALADLEVTDPDCIATNALPGDLINDHKDNAQMALNHVLEYPMASINIASVGDETTQTANEPSVEEDDATLDQMFAGAAGNNGTGDAKNDSPRP